MRITLSALFFIVFHSSSAHADGWAAKMFEGKTSHNFGTVPRGAQLSHRFEIRNVFAVPLEITQVRSSCGCATGKASKTALKPNERGYIDISMDGRRFQGEKTLTIYVTVGPKFISTAELKISATNRGDIVFNPNQVDFGVVSGSKPITKTIDIEYAGQLDWKIQQIVTEGTPFEAKVRQLYRRPGQIGYQVTVSFTPGSETGPIKKDLIVKTNDSSIPSFPILVEAMVQVPLSVTPANLDVGALTRGTPVEKRVIVRGSNPFRIERIDGAGTQVKVVGIQSNTERTLHTVTLQIQDNRVGAINQQIGFMTDQQREPVTLRVTGSVR